MLHQLFISHGSINNSQQGFQMTQLKYEMGWTEESVS